MNAAYLVLVLFTLFAILAGVYALIPSLRTMRGTFYGEGTYRDGTVTIRGVSFKVEVADTFMSRMAGLSGREPLRENEGMFFVFPMAAKHSFWMKDMRFPIDIIWIREKQIVWMKENASPDDWKQGISYMPTESADAVLEVGAGTVKRYGFVLGDDAVAEIKK